MLPTRKPLLTRLAVVWMLRSPACRSPDPPNGTVQQRPRPIDVLPWKGVMRRPSAATRGSAANLAASAVAQSADSKTERHRLPL
jgi:hypothetical protein